MSRDVRSDLEALLSDWESQSLNLPRPETAKGATRRIPVWYSQLALEKISAEKGKVVPYVEELIPDYRPIAEQFQRSRIRELKRALEANDDPYWIAWVALEVGAGTVLGETLVGRRVRAGGSKGRRARRDVERAGRNARICKAVQELHAKNKKTSWTNACDRVAADHGLTRKQIQRISLNVRW